MKVTVLYYPNSESARSVLTFQADYKMRTGQDIELVSLDTVNGSETAKTYDITSYPAILVTGEDGKLQNLWQGDQLPLIDEVNGYVLAGS